MPTDTPQSDEAEQPGSAGEAEARDARDDVDRARRKLLRAMVYAAPVVMSTVAIKPAHAQMASCGPAACRPAGGPCNPGPGCNPASCNPAGGPCNPANCRPRN